MTYHSATIDTIGRYYFLHSLKILVYYKSVVQDLEKIRFFILEYSTVIRDWNNLKNIKGLQA